MGSRFGSFFIIFAGLSAWDNSIILSLEEGERERENQHMFCC